ncbi:uncharacterized protein RSE6_11601 [Rhynchosporium secalis]|uniref:Uncharacterized protein n=1 Tax=Rhynchosporium secalis TaxID=38038 RepID=A0A1E1MNC4_RHYSE|nr:uncharacterized protein RSE6_11601 [Rhynchosporium secalis]
MSRSRPHFFKVRFITKIMFRKSQIKLGLLNGREVMKVKVKKALAFKLLTVQHPPAATTKWESDFSTYIISTAPLYPELGDHKSTSASSPTLLKVPHHVLPIPEKQPDIMETLIHYQGASDKDFLMTFVMNNGKM